MAKLSAKRRRELKSGDFVYPGSKSFPIPDEKHAKAALLISRQKSNSADPEKVKRAVKKKFPHLAKGKKRA